MLLILGAALQLAVLIVLKYSAFFASNINNLSGLLGLSAAVPVPSFVLPVGISFYTLQAVSYLADVCRGNIQADRSLPRLALYMAFFPQIMEGPICRYSQTAEQLWEGQGIDLTTMLVFTGGYDKPVVLSCEGQTVNAGDKVL